MTAKAAAPDTPSPTGAKPEGPALPHERDQQAKSATAQKPDPEIHRASKDLKQGQVDTDLRATPGLDADRRGGMVEGGEHGAGDQKGAARR